MEAVHQECWDAIVIGAGPAGALAAHQLALLGGRVLLVDRKALPRKKVCGACLSRQAVAILDAAGLSGELRNLGGKRLRQFWLASSAGAVPLRMSAGLAVSRGAFDAMLVEAAMEAGAAFVPETMATVAACTRRARSVVFQPVGASSGRTAVQAHAKVVIAADGLGHPCLASLRGFEQRPLPRSRIGAGCEVPADVTGVPEGVVQMAIGRNGYVGLVVLETGVLNVAAALDPAFVRAAGGLGDAALHILREAKLPPLESLKEAAWQGTPPLSRQSRKLAAERLFLVGDAAGYVEPFTGEGIGWALTAAVAVAPLACAAWQRWQPALEIEWQTTYERTIGRDQYVCRVLARLLKSRWGVTAAMAVLSRLPWLAQALHDWTKGAPPAIAGILAAKKFLQPPNEPEAVTRRSSSPVLAAASHD